MLGISVDELIAASQPLDGRDDGGDFLIWQDNLVALEVFLACHSQWRILTGGDKPYYQGLRYLEVEAVMRLKRVKDKATVFADVQVMEEAARDVLNER